MDSTSGELSPLPPFLVIDFDGEAHGFRSWMQSALGVEDLARLHETGPFAPLRPNDRSLLARWSALCQQRLRELMPLVAAFVDGELSRLFQSRPELRHPPRFRFHPPGWDSISPYHKESAYGLAQGASNVWVPLTPVAGSNSLWVESAEDRRDFRPVELRYGQALVFDAVRLTHGSQRNRTRSTRVSFDFRCHGILRPECLLRSDRVAAAVPPGAVPRQPSE
jgi:hypothetical protein